MRVFSRLTNCRTCQKPVSRAALTCPACGEVKPGAGPAWPFIIIGFVLIMAWAIAGFNPGLSSPQTGLDTAEAVQDLPPVQPLDLSEATGGNHLLTVPPLSSNSRTPSAPLQNASVDEDAFFSYAKGKYPRSDKLFGKRVMKVYEKQGKASLYAAKVTCPSVGADHVAILGVSLDGSKPEEAKYFVWCRLSDRNFKPNYVRQEILEHDVDEYSGRN